MKKKKEIEKQQLIRNYKTTRFSGKRRVEKAYKTLIIQ